MKKTITAALLTVASMTAQAQVTCDTVGELAETIMDVRQHGVPMREAYKVSEDEMVRMIVRDAYDTPRFNSEGYHRQMVADFGDKWFLACVEVRDD